ncbi:MAG: peptidylprolyl isomerase [Xanthomonadales bacterium]|nr:peptidylprolyl isomerase [Xanthomonadales bacterium]
MQKIPTTFLALGLTLAGLLPAAAAEPECFPEEIMPDNLFPSVRLETSMGDIIVELNRMRAPVTVNNFLRYVTEGQYDETIFHRVMDGFVVQGGGYSVDLEERDLHPPIINESGNGLKNLPMTIAMARFDDPHSATSQFYFNLAANASLDPNPRGWGYAVFGAVISGQNVVEAIAAVETGYDENLDAPDVPAETVMLKTATVLEAPH